MSQLGLYFVVHNSRGNLASVVSNRKSLDPFPHVVDVWNKDGA